MRHSNLYTCIILLLFISSCKKSFLDAKPDDALVVPSTLQDCQALLDDDKVMNGFGAGGYPCMPEIESDDYYVTSDQYDMYSPTDKQAAIWAPNIPTDNEFPDWDFPYRVIFTANNVLETVERITGGHPSPASNCIKGSAYYYRAFAYHQLAQIFAPAYDSSRAATDLGLPLRKTADINEKLTRSTVQQTYNQILGDLRTAELLLPKDSNCLPTRPSLIAVYGLLSRVFLSARDYPLALRYADSCLRLRSALMDFDTISTTTLFPFNRWNPEVIFSAAYFPSGPAATYRSHVDSTLFRSYRPGDLRKQLFFKFGDYFFGRFDQDGFCFAGITTSEMYLTRSECFARAGDTANAMADLNHLLQTRWAASTFIPYVAANVDDALQQILLERRKELLFRGIRWSDLRRLNKDGTAAPKLTRIIDGVKHELPANDPRWVLLIPDYVLSFNPGMLQNGR